MMHCATYQVIIARSNILYQCRPVGYFCVDLLSCEIIKREKHVCSNFMQIWDIFKIFVKSHFLNVHLAYLHNLFSFEPDYLIKINMLKSNNFPK